MILGRSVHALVGVQEVLHLEIHVALRISEKAVRTRRSTAHSEEDYVACPLMPQYGTFVPELLAPLSLVPGGWNPCPLTQGNKAKTRPTTALSSKQADTALGQP